MPCNRGTATAQLNRMSGLQGFGFMAPEAFTGLIDVLCSHSDDSEHARKAVDLILGRKSLPTGPQDIADALNEVRARRPISEAPRASGGGCGKELAGETYWDYDPARPVKDTTKILMPSRCVNGEIRVTKWVRVVGMVDEDGNDLKQPSDCSGKCRCAGGTL